MCPVRQNIWHPDFPISGRAHHRWLLQLWTQERFSLLVIRQNNGEEVSWGGLRLYGHMKGMLS